MILPHLQLLLKKAENGTIPILEDAIEISDLLGGDAEQVKKLNMCGGVPAVTHYLILLFMVHVEKELNR
jgi:hypothetical protein